jgi:hypothetical protein
VIDEMGAEVEGAASGERGGEINGVGSGRESVEDGRRGRIATK